MRPTHADLTRFVNDNYVAASKIGFSVLALKEIWAMAVGVRFNCSEDDNCCLGNSYFYEFHSVGNYTPKSKKWFRERVHSTWIVLVWFLVVAGELVLRGRRVVVYLLSRVETGLLLSPLTRFYSRTL